MQKTVALSSAEAEFYSASEMAVEIIYLRNLLNNMRFAAGDSTTVFEDKTACIEWSNHIMEALRPRSRSEWTHSADQDSDGVSAGGLADEGSAGNLSAVSTVCSGRPLAGGTST